MKEMSAEHREFMSEEDIAKYFGGNKTFPSQPNQQYQISDWFAAKNDHPLTVGHMHKIGDYDCDTLVDEWIKYYLTLSAQANPIGMSASGYSTQEYGSENVFLFRSGDTSVYFTAVSPGRTPDRVRIVLTRKIPVLFPIYFVETSTVENPSLKTEKELMDLIFRDLKGIKELKASFDDAPLYGCCVIRKMPLHIGRIPKDNILGIPLDRLHKTDYTIDLYHGGVWLLAKAENFTSGDHLLKFKARSVNYEIDAQMEISAMV